MRPRNLELIEIAKKYVQEEMSYCTYACLIGSVARGEADDFSDIDLICFTGRETYLGKHDVSYKGEIIQIDVKSILEFPSKELFSYNPWHYRYLVESVIIKDTNGELSKLQGWSKSYFASIQGQKDVIRDVTTIVEGRKDYAIKQMNIGKDFAATHAAIGAWTEATLLYQFLYENRVSIGSLMPTLRKLDFFPTIVDLLPIGPVEEVDIKEASNTMTTLRLYLKNAGFDHLPSISDLQDKIWHNKADRLMLEGDFYNYLWLSYSEAFLLLLETSQDEDFESYFKQLPTALQRQLEDLGLVSLLPEDIHQILDIGDKMMEYAKDQLKSEQGS
ncbi:nucleotidyltransferase domain-containing protein [Pontibacillus marinus]|uniref:Polymerase nucleotidyl transferase domain-containing protein n=1 Tax=Pontibacillus marinus BH030004 = DSM 16465 TaxID=1385511 RepID=A0A0A5G1L8_9BACI|nr:nucleotidyltransferase domain-containing protein [Pontibacillus marinus]KGX85944.1 hypothetical protein N783_13205 [Pontibacillus marinus BH030004 = DSM 16465]